jgi:hypothetical protein
VERACGRPIPATKHSLEASLLDRPVDFDKQLERFKQADPEALRARWRALFRKTFPAHLPRHLIVSMLAYRIQADALGDIGKSTQKYLTALGHQEGKLLAPAASAKPQHMSGTQYEREHDGVLHRVMKTEGGFQWRENEYKSLSAVAHAITGTKWNGPRFFGIDQKERL